MPILKLTAEIIRKPLVKPFAIATGSRDYQDVLYVTLSDGQYLGRGAATGVKYLGLTPDICLQQVKEIQHALKTTITRQELLTLLPPTGARFAIDSALWELEAARQKTTVAALLGIDPKPVKTAFTIVLDTPEAMAEQARTEAWRPLLKVKLGGSTQHEIERIHAVRNAAPKAQLVIDANAAWTGEQFSAYAPAIAELGYDLLEQPFAIGQDNQLANYAHRLPLCADESFQDLHDLDRAAKYYDAVNIKLDKCGGLTAALDIEKAARERGLKIFIGCMLAPTQAIAPAFLLAQKADYVDLDGPFWFTDKDKQVRLTDQGLFDVIPQELWGTGQKL